MPKTKISEFSATPANNTDIDSINIAEGCAPSGINDAIRELMAQLKDFQTGAVGDSFNGPIGATTASTGAFTTLSSTGNTTLGDASGDSVTVNGTATFANANPTLTAGTANGVTYLNGSKVLTSGSALQFDGTSLFVGATSAVAGKLVVKDTASSNTVWLVGRTSDGASSVSFRNAADSAYTGRIELDPSVGMLVGTTGATTQLTLSNAGNLGLGVTPSAWGNTYKAFQAGTTSVLAGVASQTNNYVLHNFVNCYNDNTNWVYIASQEAGRYEIARNVHKWYNAASGTAGNTISFTQAMMLDASGNLLVGTTSNTRPARLRVDGDETAHFTGYGNGYGVGIFMTPNASATGGTANAISFQNVSNATVGTISTTAGATAYNTSSDYRLKNTISPMTGALSKVALLKPCTYKWNVDGSDGEGFIAHELAEVCPNAVTGEKDAVDADGNPKYQGIDTSFLVATLTAAIQELKAEFDAYKASHL